MPGFVAGGGFEAEAHRQHEKDALGPEARNDLRDWAALVTRVEFDRQNRMPVPSELRTLANLDQEVLFVGVLTASSSGHRSAGWHGVQSL